MMTPRVATLPVLVLALALAACGDDTSATGSGGGTSSSTGATASTGTGVTTGAGTGTDAATTGPGGTGGGGQGGAAQGTGGAGTGGGTVGPVTIGGDRPVEVFIPSSYQPGTPMPLVVLLHGYSATGQVQELYFGIKPLAEELGFLYVVPDGTVDSQGNQFWNATDACCNFNGSDVDDSTYLSGLIEEARAALDVDPKQVHFIGHSNGGFMSYRMACDHAGLVASVATLAGATWLDDDLCNPSEPVAALQIHGTSDATILYDGGAIGPFGYPGAEETVSLWAAHGDCDVATSNGAARDLVAGAPTEEAEVTFHAGCVPGGGAELWTIPGAPHIPSLSPTFSRQAITWLLDHPKP